VRSQGTGFLLRRAAGPAAFTLLLVPHSGQNGKRWFIPTILMRLAAAMLLVSLVTLTWLVADYLRLQRAAEENQELRALVNEQERQIQALGLQAAVVRERMAELELLDAEVRQMVGLPTAEEERNAASTTVSSRGGPAQRVTLTDIRNTLTLAAMEIEPAKERLEDLKKRLRRSKSVLLIFPTVGLLRVVSARPSACGARRLAAVLRSSMPGWILLRPMGLRYGQQEPLVWCLPA
jgi:hypothetical protein